MTRWQRALCVLALLLGAPLLLAQQPPATTHIIRGRVVAADDGTLVLRGARITVNGGPAVAPVFTDAAGEFRVSVPTEYSLGISKAGFAPAIVTGRASAESPELVVRLARGAVIEGQIVDSSGNPVHNARVRARRVDAGGGAREFIADADDAGLYRIGSLPAGRYELHTERTAIDTMGFQPSVDPQMHEQMQQRALAAPVRPMSAIASVELTPGEQSTITLVHQTYAVLPPDAPIGGFVSGTVVDEFGDPLEGVSVQLWRVRHDGSRYVARAVGAPRRTDNRGAYRHFWVLPGRYILAAAMDDARVAPVYYPGATGVGRALPVVVERSQEHSAIDIRFTRTYETRVFGFALNAAGEPLRGILTLQARSRGNDVTLAPRIVNANADGTFEFLNVAPGEYALSAAPGRPTTPELALHLVTVDGPDLAPITIRTAPTATISGRVVIEGASTPPGGVNVVASVDADYRLPVLFPSVNVPTMTFQATGLAGPVRFFLRNPPQGWWLKAVTVGGVNAAEAPALFNGPDSSRSDVTVVLSASTGRLSGRVVNDTGSVPDDYRVLVFATNPQLWFEGSPYVQLAAGPEVDGGFTVPSLPPSDYFVVAVGGVGGDLDGEWQNPDVLSALSTRAQRVTVGERQRASADLRLIRWAR